MICALLRSWLTIPAFAGLAVALAAGAGQAQTPPAAPKATGAFETPREVWAGEVFDLALAWRVNWADFGHLEGDMAWTAAPLVAEAWSEPKLREMATGSDMAVIERRTQAMALEPGTVRLQPARQMMVLRTGVLRTEDYERAITAAVPVQTTAAQLTVRPLPSPPPGFSGAVGAFHLTSTVDRTMVRVGETLSWTVSLDGAGSWPAIRGLPARRLSRDFELIGTPSVEEAGETLFARSLRETVKLTPRRAGDYVLGAVELVAFDPAAGRYVRLRSAPVPVHVQPGPGGEGAAPPVGASAPPDGEALPQLLASPGQATPPPRDGVWFAALAAGPGAVLALWLSLAFARARRLDPHRGPRRAHGRLARTLDRLGRVRDPAETARLLRGWQADAAVRLGVGKAAPTPEDLPADSAWRVLWEEADLALYARDAALPADWRQRAVAALGALGRPPPFDPRSILRRASLLPALAAAAVSVCAPDFARAAASDEAALTARLAVQPLDWRSRHDLAVVLGAQRRWDEAAGHAAVAWVQAPRAAETRRLWILVADKAGVDPQTPRPGARLADALSAPAWRWAVLGAALIGSLGAGMGVLARYRRLSPLWTRAGAALIVAGVLAGGLAAWSLRAYGPLAAPDAVIVWKAAPLRPAPVETPAETAPAQLPAGATARADGASFLGWRRVRLADGRTGWVRTEHLVWVWRATPG